MTKHNQPCKTEPPTRCLFTTASGSTAQAPVLHVENKHYTSLLLMRTEGSNIIVIKNGEYEKVLTGRRHSLVHNKLLDVFDLLSGQIAFQQANISDPQFKKVNEDYFDLSIKNAIDVASIEIFNSRRLKI